MPDSPSNPQATQPVPECIAKHEANDLTDFSKTIRNLSMHRDFIWRGQMQESWRLEPSIDRLIRRLNPRDPTAFIENHLDTFKRSARGRRAPYTKPFETLTDHEWWALGQHNGLATPLLDWTRSPYIALFFAFEESPSPESNCETGTRPPAQHRVVYGLSTSSFHSVAKAADDDHPITPNPIQLIDPLTDDNYRLVNQRGLFTLAKPLTDIKTWATDNFKHEMRPTLLMITLPDCERDDVLRNLNRMNINHLTLFPDLDGSCRFTNFTSSIQHY